MAYEGAVRLGNDGNWSTFSIGVGTPPQLLELLPSTQVPESWVVLTEGCTDEDPRNCSITRGGLFNYDVSSTWVQKDIYALGSEANLGYTSDNSNNGAYGWENISWAATADVNVTASHTVIAGIATKDFYLGILGLAARSITWEDLSTSPPSLISILKEQGLIETQSYGYTAGAFYKNAPGSLTIGGYDESRLVPNDVSFAFGSQLQRQLTVVVQGITVTASDVESQMLTQGIYALVDSTVAHLWLPVAVCQAFEDAFGIEFDPITNLYLVNDTQHEAMLKQNAQVTFTLATSLNGGSVVRINLPYASFDLQADPPLVKARSRYFPLRRAKDETQHTIGRVFLQEAFIIVDDDQKSFSISQAQYTSGAPARIAATKATTDTNSTTSNNTNVSDSPPLVKTTSAASNGMSTGAKAGIAAGIVVLAVAVIAFCLWKFKFSKSRRSHNGIKDKPELEGDAQQRPGFDEAYGKQRRPSADSARGTKSGAHIKVNEMSQKPLPAELQGADFGGRGPTAEMDHEQTYRAELPSPDPFGPELEAHSLSQIRSELSTPEPPSELSTSDPSLVPELTSISRHEAHELSSSNRNSRPRPTSYRNDSCDSDIFPSESASTRPGLYGRKSSQDTINTPVSPHPRRESLRAVVQRRNSGLTHHRLNSSSSHDTFETRIYDSLSPHLRAQGAPSPLASLPSQPASVAPPQRSEGYAWGAQTPPIGSQPSPSLSGLNSPTTLHPQRIDSGPPTPGLFDLTEQDPLMGSHPQPRGTKFTEGFTGEPGIMANKEGPREDARTAVVRNEVGRIEGRARSEGN
ncbi:MAG: hypothetical protein Q9208_001616 [Pyrenodesmia sp. 3 TL-2023]